MEKQIKKLVFAMREILDLATYRDGKRLTKEEGETVRRAIKLIAEKALLPYEKEKSG